MGQLLLFVAYRASLGVLVDCAPVGAHTFERHLELVRFTCGVIPL